MVGALDPDGGRARVGRLCAGGPGDGLVDACALGRRVGVGVARERVLEEGEQETVRPGQRGAVNWRLERGGGENARQTRKRGKGSSEVA